MKFLRLTTPEGEIVYLNSNEIRSFQKGTNAPTCIDLQYGTRLVMETPEEIFTMLGGDKK